MSNLLKKPELLLPAGSPEKLRYAVAYGADAVYLGLPMTSLRTPGKGQQFTARNLASEIAYAQSRNVKAYVTINIFPSNHDLKRLIPHLELLESIAPDAIIFTDPGTFRLARRYAPSVPLHLSTQANTLNTQACAFWQDLGVERVILAREVPYREIVEIHEQLPDLQLECFIHGSLCVAYSGRCVISDYLTDNTKNSNKGMCGNSCRWEFQEATATGTVNDKPEAQSCGCSSSGQPSSSEISFQDETAEQNFDEEASSLKTLSMVEQSRPDNVYVFEEDEKGSYMLNSKDLCLVRHLQELQAAGICSFKVEGRTKSVYYVSNAGRIYRNAIDRMCSSGSSPVSEEEMTHWVAELSQAGNRGFTEGFYDGRPNRHAYNYSDSNSHQTSVFLGLALPDGFSAKTPDAHYPAMQFTLKNPVAVGMTLDWITPLGAHAVTLTKLYNREGFPIHEGKTNHQVSIPVPQAVLSAIPAEQLAEQLQWSVLRSSSKVTGLNEKDRLVVS
jgi:U32 family peptidase